MTTETSRIYPCVCVRVPVCMYVGIWLYNVKRELILTYTTLYFAGELTHLCTMASGGQYGGGDVVDKWLMNRVVRHASHDELGSLARDLRIDKSVYENITAPNDRVFEVSI